MKILCIMGSPRKQGNTATVLGWVEEELRAAGHAVEHVDVVDREIDGCTGCNTCKLEPKWPGCVIEDDADALFKMMMEIDLAVLATPLYVWGFPSQLKALLDRAYALKKPSEDGAYSLIAGKRLALLVTCAGPYEGNAELLAAPFERIAGFAQAGIAGTLFVTETSVPDMLGEEWRERAIAFAREIAA